MAIELNRQLFAIKPATGAALVAEFEAATPRSKAAAERARKVMPGGETRTVTFHAPYPLTGDHGSGCQFADLDGRSYYDLISNYTSLLHGHNHPVITAAVIEQLSKGTTFATALEAQVVLGEILTERVQSMDMVRYTNSGTEATMNAVRAVRAFTGRELIVKMEGGYHGSFDDFEVSVHPDLAFAGPVEAPTPTIDARGVVAGTVDTVLVAPFNNVDVLTRIMAEQGDQVAGIIIEPVMGSAGTIAADPEFLVAAQDLAHKYGALFIADEVMTFRLGYGGMQEVYGIAPDLTTFAKIIGGGFPVGAFGGRREVMSIFDARGANPVFQSGTFNGNAVTMVAGAKAMELFSREEVARLNGLGDQLRTGLMEQMAAHHIPGTVTGYGSMVGVHLVEGDIRNYRDGAVANQTLKRAIHLALLLEGVFAAPRLMMCTSTPMTEADVAEIVARFGRALDRVQA
ncbi:MAG TPA: aspartate aminotransferase family protein [Thermomicrobiales bacterium]|nr:aspartate aminotransferase family protein [Thermomicrobiales bacterium]